MPNIKEILTRKIGPLPTYAWGGVGIGGILLARRMLNRDASGGTASTESMLFDSAIPVDVTGRRPSYQDPYYGDPFFEPPIPLPVPVPPGPVPPPPSSGGINNNNPALIGGGINNP